MALTGFCPPGRRSDRELARGGPRGNPREPRPFEGGARDLHQDALVVLVLLAVPPPVLVPARGADLHDVHHAHQQPLPSQDADLPRDGQHLGIGADPGPGRGPTHVLQPGARAVPTDAEPADAHGSDRHRGHLLGLGHGDRALPHGARVRPRRDPVGLRARRDELLVDAEPAQRQPRGSAARDRRHQHRHRRQEGPQPGRAGGRHPARQPDSHRPDRSSGQSSQPRPERHSLDAISLTVTCLFLLPLFQSLGGLAFFLARQQGWTQLYFYLICLFLSGEMDGCDQGGVGNSAWH